MVKEVKKLDDLFHDTLKDIYFAEKKILTALPKMAKAAHSEDLRAAFEKHHSETQGQVERLEEVFDMIGRKPQGKTCDAIIGLVEEGQGSLKACCLIGPSVRPALRPQSSPMIRGNVAVVRHGATALSTQSGAVLLELSPSRMRDSGWDQLPPDVRFAGDALQKMRAPPWIAIYLNQPLTEKPSCEAGHMTASDLCAARQMISCQAGAIHT